MKKIYKYDALKERAVEAKASLFKERASGRKGRRARTKPRDERDLEAIFTMAMSRKERFKPQKKGNCILLPYYLTIDTPVLSPKP